MWWAAQESNLRPSAAELVAIRAGHDRAVEVRALKERPTDTVSALAEHYLKHAHKVKKTAREDERMLKRDVLPSWRDRSVRSVTRRESSARMALESQRTLRVTDRGGRACRGRLARCRRRGQRRRDGTADGREKTGEFRRPGADGRACE